MKMLDHSKEPVEINFRGVPEIPVVNYSWKTISKALDMSKNIPLTSSDVQQSNDE